MELAFQKYHNAFMTRGRPKEFDEDAAVRAAMQVFWERGYRAATCEELTAEMGISTSSFYSTFHDKEQLFRRAFTLYATEIFGQIYTMLDAEGSPLATVRKLMNLWADHFGKQEGSPGCLVAMSLIETEAEDSEVKQQAKELVTRLQTKLESCFRRAVKAGELSSDFDCRSAAAFMISTTEGLTVMARSGAKPSDIRGAVEMALRVIQ